MFADCSGSCRHETQITIGVGVARPSVPSVLWCCWLGLLTCKNRRPYNLYCVGGDVKPCSINQSLVSGVHASVATSRSQSPTATDNRQHVTSPADSQWLRLNLTNISSAPLHRPDQRHHWWRDSPDSCRCFARPSRKCQVSWRRGVVCFSLWLRVLD